MIKRVKTIPPLIYELKPSTICRGEVGAFAVRRLKAGDLIDRVDSPEEVVWISARDVKKLDRQTRRKIYSFCPLDKDGEYCVPADINNMGSSWYLNHSCDPNVEYDKHGNLVAARSIKNGEELFLDYGRMFTDPKFSMHCRCGSPKCRGRVSGRDWLNPRFRSNNIGSMWPDMR